MRPTAFRFPTRSASSTAIWVEPLACVLRAAELVPRGRVLVVGCGAIGRLWIQVLVRRGDSVVGDRPARRPAGGERASSAPSCDDDPVDAAVLTAPAGVNDALARLEPGGTLLVFAAPAGAVPTSLDAVYRKELRVVGSRSATPASLPAAIELLPSLVAARRSRRCRSSASAKASSSIGAARR